MFELGGIIKRWHWKIIDGRRVIVINRFVPTEVSLFYEQRPTPNREDIVEDGFGNSWSAWCKKCGKKTIEIVRPGKVQCSNCE